MRTLKSRYERQRFSEVFNFGQPTPVLVDVPVEENGQTVIVTTEKPYEKPKDVLYSAYTAAKVYEMGDVTPIQLFDNMSSAEKLSYVQQFEKRIDNAMSNVKN